MFKLGNKLTIFLSLILLYVKSLALSQTLQQYEASLLLFSIGN